MRPTRTKVRSNTRVPVSTQSQLLFFSERSLCDRSGAVVQTGTETGPVLSLSTGTSTPLKGVRTSERAERESSAPPRSAAIQVPQWAAEIEGLRAALLPVLPLPVTLCCLCSGFRRDVYLCFEPAVSVALRARNAVVFGAVEWNALVSSFEYGRASAASFVEWCECKAQQPTWKLQLGDALGCVIGSEPERYPVPTTVGAVLRGWDCTPQRVHYGRELPT